MVIDLGECPRCGSADVQHIVYGMVGPRTFENAPPWVRFAGCAVQPQNRVCQTCGHSWYDEHPAPDWDAAPEM